MTERVDLLVLGGGMAGMTAAARAATAGASVLVVDVAPQVGGSARFAGVAWTAPSHEVMDRINPDGDPELRRVVVDEFPATLDWIRSTGTELAAEMPVLGYGRGHRFDTNHYLDACAGIVREAGGRILTSAQSERLAVDGSASTHPAVRGARVRHQDVDLEVEAAWTLLATGGFARNEALLSQHIHPAAGRMPVRANAHSAGGGYGLGLAAGAASAGAAPGFYGHLVPTHIPFTGPEDFLPLSLFFSEHALLFNLRGERFTDESRGDHLTNMALLEQPEARGLLIADARVHREWITQPYVKGSVTLDRFALASRRGGRVGVADDLAELAYLPEEWGYPGGAIAAAIGRHNDALLAGGAIEPDRERDRTPLTEGPYYVVECQPAITYPFHGLRIDPSARVLDEAGRPIQGLLCAGSDTGGIYHRAYAGGLATAAAFATRAVGTALGSTRD
ncbi:FAD-binding protein [Nocardioides sp. AE5]|uniref:FAD-binding protein n=1 Tax=Nocardioides sp. AE5 TaxID=2962573 RepID=UPI00288105FE|nr:FAD-binding protein [Nocardioides sp. AE5]MDT0202706.1 FAD-binding protein [Nocardioides sp. AE5]